MPTSDRPVVLITGAAKRVGLACAHAFASAGCDLILTYRSSRAEAESAAAALSTLGSSVSLEQLPMDDLNEVDSAARALAARTPRLDVLIHNASAYDKSPLHTLSPSDVLSAFTVNCAAPLMLSRAVAPLLTSSPLPAGASILSFGDIHALGEHGLPRQRDFLAYSLSKAALAEMTRSLARELAPRVRVNMLAFGVVAWPDSGHESDRPAQDAYLRSVPLARAGTPEEAASAARWLCLEASYITGQILRLDGGRSMV